MQGQYVGFKLSRQSRRCQMIGSESHHSNSVHNATAVDRQSTSDTLHFQRPGGWSAVEVARLPHNDPSLKQDRNLAMWWAEIINHACTYARGFLNRIFPENLQYRFCKLPQWPSVLPWIGWVKAKTHRLTVTPNTPTNRTGQISNSCGGAIPPHGKAASSDSVPASSRSHEEDASAAACDFEDSDGHCTVAGGFSGLPRPICLS